MNINQIIKLLYSNGSVLCDMNYPIPIAKVLVVVFEAFNVKYPVIAGPVIAYVNTGKAPATIKKIIRIIDKSNGTTLKKKPR